jgi:hypothetical protein
MPTSQGGRVEGEIPRLSRGKPKSVDKTDVQLGSGFHLVDRRGLPGAGKSKCIVGGGKEVGVRL